MADVQSLSHSAICVHDLAEAEAFYCGALGARPSGGVNFVTEDTIKGRSIHKDVVIGDYLFALALASDFMPMPPDDQLRGAHGFSHAFAVKRAHFAAVIDSLKSHNVRFEGPVVHPEHGPFGESIYFKDPSGNFLEVLWRRDEDVAYEAVEAKDAD
jgi:catechol-2,3-dioxygenase